MINLNSNNWSSYKRKLVNISKAVFNPIVSEYITKHYFYLSSRLIKSDSDKDIFNDTYLKLTYCYDPEKDFIELFIYYFNLLKGAYYRDDKVANYYLTLESNEVASVIDDTDDEPVEKPDKSILNLKENILQYANFKKSQKRANKED